MALTMKYCQMMYVIFVSGPKQDLISFLLLNADDTLSIQESVVPATAEESQSIPAPDGNLGVNVLCVDTWDGVVLDTSQAGDLSFESQINFGSLNLSVSGEPDPGEKLCNSSEQLEVSIVTSTEQSIVQVALDQLKPHQFLHQGGLVGPVTRVI